MSGALPEGGPPPPGDDVYAPYCKTCGGMIHRGRSATWVHYKREAPDVDAVLREFDMEGREAEFLRALVTIKSLNPNEREIKILRAFAASIEPAHKAEPVWTSAEARP